MQAHELYTLSSWYKSQVTDNESIITLYTKALNSIKASSANNTNIHAIRKQSLELLLNKLSSIDYSELNDTHRAILLDMELTGLILEPAIESLKHLFSPTSDNSFIVNILNSNIATLNKAHAALIHTYTYMPVILKDELLYAPKTSEGKYLTRLTFHNKASINNVVELKEWSKSWHTIARGFSMANNQPPEDFEIVSADRGSFIVDLQLTLETVKLISETLTSISDLAISLTGLYTALESAKLLKKMLEPEIYKTALTQATDNIKKEEDELIEKVLKMLEDRKLILNLQSRNELHSAIKELISFNEKGGSIKCIASNKENDVENKIIENLNDSYLTIQNKTEIRLIEKKDRK